MEDWLIFQIRPLVEYRQNQRTQNKLIEWRGETRAWLQNQTEQKKVHLQWTNMLQNAHMQF